MKLFKRKEERRKITNRSNVIQYDDMGYPLRLVIVDEKEQIWIDTCEEEGDVVLNWKTIKHNSHILRSSTIGIYCDSTISANLALQSHPDGSQIPSNFTH